MSEGARPPVWIGHIGPYEVPDLAAATTFYTDLGLRRVAGSAEQAILELRGGTHVILRERPGSGGGSVPFDLMVEDLDATHNSVVGMGAEPSAIKTGAVHRSFEVTDPAGATLTINDSHVMGPV